MSLSVGRAPATVAELVAAIAEPRGGTSTTLGREPAVHFDVRPPTGSTALVVGAHSGAGASAVAVALADAAARRQAVDGHALVRLVDAAPHESSGLIGAAGRELGADPSGWRIGSRGKVEIHRPAAPVSSPDELPGLAPFDFGRLVVDAGWQLHELQAAPNPITTLMSRAALVLVCRATVPGVRQAERVLSDLPSRTVVVGVGARRWPGRVRATFGPLLAAAYDAGQVALMPADHRLEVNGIDADQMPKAFADAASRLLDLVWPALQPASTHRAKE